MDAYRNRDIGPYMERALRSMPVVVLTGMRQVGKTTFLWNQMDMAETRRYSLDQLGTLDLARSDPFALVQGEGPVIIDEIQRVPDLLLAVKHVVFENPGAGRFILSGSANLRIMRDVSESLAGRAIYLYMWPMTYRELNNIKEPPFLIDLLERGEPRMNDMQPRLSDSCVLRGGMPPVALGQADPEIWFTGYEQTYLERDIRELTQVADLAQFRRFVRLAALRTAAILNVADLARNAGLASTTAHRYMGLLETAFLGFRLPPFLANRSSRLVKNPKFFISDSGLANHLMGGRTTPMGPDDPFAGALLETYVAQNLQGLLAAFRPSATLCYWNVQGRYEVDFVVEDGQRCVAIEVKSVSRWRENDLQGLRKFLDTTPNCQCAILACNTQATVRLADRLYAVPLSQLLR